VGDACDLAVAVRGGACRGCSGTGQPRSLGGLLLVGLLGVVWRRRSDGGSRC